MTRRYNGKTKTAENKGKGYPKETHGADTGREGKGGQPRSTGAREGTPGKSGKTQKGNATTGAGKGLRPTRSTAGGARRAKSPPTWSAPAHPRSTQPPEPAGLGGTAGGTRGPFGHAARALKRARPSPAAHARRINSSGASR